MHVGKRSDARIPGRCMQLADVRVRGQRPNDRMLSTAATYHEYAHVSGAYLLNQRPDFESLVAPGADADRADRRAR